MSKQKFKTTIIAMLVLEILSLPLKLRNHNSNRNNRHEEPDGGLYATFKENAGDCAVNGWVEKIRELFRYADEQQICKSFLGDSLLSLLRTCLI